MTRASSGTGARSAEAGLLAALLGLLTWTALARAHVQPFWGWYYHFAWYTTLVGLDAGLALREGRWTLFSRPRLALCLFLWSVPVWLLFELLNFRIANWYYVFATPDLLLRRAGTAAAFATVLPAIYLGHRWMDALGLAARWRTTGFGVGRRTRLALVGFGVLFLGLALAWPPVFFPLVWGSLTLLLEPWNHARDPERSLLGVLSRGRPTRIVRLLAAGACVGLLWELFNAAALTRWIYTVPGLERLKLFEMPFAGYLGFPVFALDCFVVYRALVNLRVAVEGWDGALEAPREPGGAGRGGEGEPRRLAVAALLAATFSLAVLAGIDRWTVDSWAPSLRDLPGATAEEVRALRSGGVGDITALAEAEVDSLVALPALDPPRASELVETARLVSLRGLGVRNAAALREAGIRSVCGLARAEVDEVAGVVGRMTASPRAGSPARVRIWIRSAREACRDRAAPGRSSPTPSAAPTTEPAS